MRRKAIVLLTTIFFTVGIKAQVIINPKGTRVTIDSGKWTLTGNDIYNKNSGKVGIGTTSPLSKLAVIGGTTGPEMGITLANTASDNTNKFSFLKGLPYSNSNPPVMMATMASDASTSALSLGSGSASHTSPTSIEFYTDADNNMATLGSTQRMIISQNGNVGFGVSSPSYQLHAVNAATTNVTAAAFLTPNLATGNSTVFKFGVAASTGNVGDLRFYYNGVNDNLNRFELGFHGKGTPNIAMMNSGLVGIGTTTPTQKLQVTGVNGQPTGMNSITTNATFRVYGGTNHALDFGTFTNSPYGCYIESQNLNAATTLPLVLNPSGGQVGIGVINPDAPLHVNGTTVSTPAVNRTYFQYQGFLPGLTSNNTTATASIQVHANGWFWADGGGFVATSDARIKNIIGNTNTAKDLETLNRIQITDYTYIDKIANSARPQKKVIAQQLRDVFPTAVNQNAGVIPNVFETAAGSQVVGNSTNITTSKMHGFKTGDTVRLILEGGGEKILPVTVTDERNFSVTETLNSRVFVYGKKVNDLLSVDYDAVAMLNVSATQEVSKQLDSANNKIAQLETDNAELKKLVTEIQTQLSEISKKLETKAEESNTDN